MDNTKKPWKMASTPHWMTFWGKPGKGRYHKRRLSKARRAAARAICAGNRPRWGGLRNAETDCNWKGT